MFKYTGPWIIINKLPGSSYKIRHKIKNVVDKRHASHLSPFPLELMSFTPISGSDNEYGQIHKPITKDAFKSAGVTGFHPVQPFQSAFLNTSDIDEPIQFPSLSDLNDEIFPYEPGEKLILDESSYSDVSNSIEHLPVMTVPPPPAYQPPTPPTIQTLTVQIIQSVDKLFFLSIRTPNSTHHEWFLVRIALEDSMSLHPACLHDGKFLVDFYIRNPSDVRYNACNQRYWLEYYPKSNIFSPTQSETFHLVKPSQTSKQFARDSNLVPFQMWVYPLHKDTYIHGPFNFATINNRKTRDWISQTDWELLSKHSRMFHNEIPSTTLPTFSIHVDRSIHLKSFSNDSAAQVFSLAASPEFNPEQMYQ